jgi:putative flavoprotein involved in K+ transport
MRKTDAIIIGAGQAGLAMSYCLGSLGIDHIVLERGNVAERWRSERWDSLRLLTPNWMNRLPGWWYRGDDPDGFMPASELLAFLEAYSKDSGAPVITGAAVLSVRRVPGGYRVESERGTWNCRCVVIATGHCDAPFVPTMAAKLPAGIRQPTPTTYRNPRGLPEGGVLVVGASASGVQLAEEIQKSGRQVTLSVGRHTRLPRMYRGQDIMWWLDAQTTLEGDFATNTELKDARSQPSLQLVGRPAPAELNLGVLRDLGVRLVGRLRDIDCGVVRLNDDLRLNVAESHARMLRLLHRVDALADMDEAPAEAPPAPFEVPDTPATLHLADHRIQSVIWATGFRRDYRWLHVPVVDSCGEIIQTGGVTPSPGLYVTGIRFLRRRDASFIAAVAGDAVALAAEIHRHLDVRPYVAA